MKVNVVQLSRGYEWLGAAEPHLRVIVQDAESREWFGLFRQFPPVLRIRILEPQLQCVTFRKLQKQPGDTR